MRSYIEEIYEAFFKEISPIQIVRPIFKKQSADTLCAAYRKRFAFSLANCMIFEAEEKHTKATINRACLCNHKGNAKKLNSEEVRCPFFDSKKEFESLQS